MKTIYVVINLKTKAVVEAYMKEQDAAARVSELELKSAVDHAYSSIILWEI